MNTLELLGKANQMRESGKFVESLQLLDQALLEFVSEKEYGKAAESLCSQFLTYKHLSELDPVYLILAESAINNSIEMAQLSSSPSDLVLPFFNLGKLKQLQNKLNEAQEAFQKAIELFQVNPPENHNRPSVLIDFKIHYQVVRLLLGNLESVSELNSLIAELEGLDEPKYNKDVWISGAQMRLAEALVATNPDLAKEHMARAKKIIDDNPELKLRSAQWQKLNQKVFQY